MPEQNPDFQQPAAAPLAADGTQDQYEAIGAPPDSTDAVNRTSIGSAVVGVVNPVIASGVPA